MITCARCDQPLSGDRWAICTDEGWRHRRCPSAAEIRTAWRVEGVEWMVATGERREGIARRLEMTEMALIKMLQREGRHDLIERMPSHVTRCGEEVA